MPSIPIHLPAHSLAANPSIPQPTPDSTPANPNPLPQLLHTPTGLAILEIQGTLNLPPATFKDSSPAIPVGRLQFPLYDYGKAGRGEEQQQGDKWMKLVYLYVGGRQRMTGEVKRLDKPVAVLRKREGAGEEGEGGEEELEIMDVVRWKVIFSNRPEPVG